MIYKIAMGNATKLQNPKTQKLVSKQFENTVFTFHCTIAPSFVTRAKQTSSPSLQGCKIVYKSTKQLPTRFLTTTGPSIFLFFSFEEFLPLCCSLIPLKINF